MARLPAPVAQSGFNMSMADSDDSDELSVTKPAAPGTPSPKMIVTVVVVSVVVSFVTSGLVLLLLGPKRLLPGHGVVCRRCAVLHGLPVRRRRGVHVQVSHK
ncbi:unnamed protein product [Ixodes persulcatus]